MNRYTYSMGPASVRVESAEELPHWHQWAETFSGFEEALGPEPAPSLTASIHFADELSPLGADADSLTLHAERAGRGLRRSDGALEVENLDKPAHYTVTATSVGQIHLDMVYPYGQTYWELDAFQLVRGWIQAVAESSGRKKFHGSALAKGDFGIVFVGDSGAGKTSFMLSALRSGKYAFISNDKLHIDESGTIYGLPMSAAISTDSLGDIPELRVTRSSRVMKSKLYLWPDQLAHALATSCQADAPLRLVIQADIDLSASGVSIAPLDGPSISRLANGPIRHFTDRVQPHWIIDELGLRASPGLTEAAFRVPWLRATGNPWSDAWWGALDEVVSRLSATARHS
ncbi:hypothetical protein AB0J83_08540 [Actinoplanes sp. NPDC049596]|uniref:hypothetical protein n=1 Tax=unclassified Actinoplanes TaxID=2626549 RepID=UPI00343605E3